MPPFFNAWVLIGRPFCLFWIVMKGSVCLAMPAVVKGTHIPRSTVHVNCFIPPTLLLSLLDTDTIKQVWSASHVWISLSLRLSVCPFLYFRLSSLFLFMYFPISVPLSLLLNSWLPSWTSPLTPLSRPWNSCLAKRDNHRALSRSYSLWNLTGSWARFKAESKVKEEDNITVGEHIWCVRFNGTCGGW